jgi:hypothetical protein
MPDTYPGPQPPPAYKKRLDPVPRISNLKANPAGRPIMLKTPPKILILDGIFGSHHRWESLRRKLDKEVAETSIWEYDNRGHTAPSVLGQRLAEWLDKEPKEVAFVGYSMGGMIVREAARLRDDKKIKAAAFLHCPHQGTMLGQAGAWLNLPAAKELKMGSDFLRGLPKHRFPILTTWSPYDLVIIPGVSASMACEKSVRIDIPAHNAPVWAPSIHREVMGFLGKHLQPAGEALTPENKAGRTGEHPEKSPT